jgi:methionine-rich copper-binding protein CopC
MSLRNQQPDRPTQSDIAKRHGWRTHLPRLAILTFALVAGLAFSFFAFVPSAAAHALPVKTDPSPRELVQAPPPRVVIQFSENVNPQVASIRVLDQARRPVDSNDTQVDPADPHIVSVSLPLLKSGTYTVVWRVQSADDGHVSSGSYYFQIARADGSAPPAPTTDASGAVDDASAALLDGPSLFQAIASWIALALLTVWVGGLIWETWILNPSTTRDPDLVTATQTATRRFRALIPTVLGLLVLANVAVVLAQAAASAGDWSGAISPTYLRAVLFGSRYGTFWWIRQITALVALYLTYAATSRGWASARPVESAATTEEIAANARVRGSAGSSSCLRRCLSSLSRSLATPPLSPPIVSPSPSRWTCCTCWRTAPGSADCSTSASSSSPRSNSSRRRVGRARWRLAYPRSARSRSSARFCSPRLARSTPLCV